MNLIRPRTTSVAFEIRFSELSIISACSPQADLRVADTLRSEEHAWANLNFYRFSSMQADDQISIKTYYISSN